MNRNNKKHTNLITLPKAFTGLGTRYIICLLPATACSRATYYVARLTVIR